MIARDVADAVMFNSMTWALIWFAWEATDRKMTRAIAPAAFVAAVFLALSVVSLVVGF